MFYLFFVLISRFILKNIPPSDLQIVQMKEVWLKSASNINKMNQKYY